MAELNKVDMKISIIPFILCYKGKLNNNPTDSMPNRDEFQSVRKEYQVGSLDEQNLPSFPIELFKLWYQDARKAGSIEPNAFALATCINHIPSVRYVLLKDISSLGFSFFTNYESQKGQELQANPICAGTFYWKELERQVRFVGEAKRLSEQENDAYFATRPKDAQIGVHVSRQSQVIPDRDFLEQGFKLQESKFSTGEIARPSYWGGYVVELSMIEFWQGRVGRLHDRIRYTKKLASWNIERLSP